MTDAIVVGAGPAGAWAAYCLARRGARVTLIDASHPREKPCGGGVTGRALAVVAGGLDLDRLPSCAIRSARFVDASSGASASVALDDRSDADLIVASRTAFDGALVDAARDAGAAIAPARVTDITTTARGFRVETSAGAFDARELLGADGATSLVRRRLARPFRRDQLSLATGYFARGITSDEIVIEFVADPPGYIWSFPRPTHLAIGICAQADAGVTAAALRGRVLEWTRASRIADGAALQPYSWPIPSLGAADFDRLEITGSAWGLAGDAAGLVDPITREGIYFALLSGEWAADAMASAKHDRWRRYGDRVRDEIGSELARAASLKSRFFRPRFTGLMMRALAESAAIRSVMADLVAGRQTYARLKRRLFTTFELGLAWRLFVSERNSRRAS